MRTALFAFILTATATTAFGQEIASNSIPRPQVGVSHLDAKDFAAQQPSLANVPAERKTYPTSWKLSLLALAGASVADTLSSWGHREGNGAIAGSNNRFDARSASMKSGIIGGVAVMEVFYLRKTHGATARKFSTVNFIAAGATAAAAGYNYNLHRR